MELLGPSPNTPLNLIIQAKGNSDESHQLSFDHDQGFSLTLS